MAAAAVSGAAKRKMDSLRRKIAINTSAGKNTATRYLHKKAAKNAAALASHGAVLRFSHASANIHKPSAKNPSAPASRVAMRDAYTAGASMAKIAADATPTSGEYSFRPK